MLSPEAIDKIVELSNNFKLDEKDGVPYHVNHKGAKVVEWPELETLPAFSLTQLMNYIEHALKGTKEQVIINVEYYDKVTALIATRNIVREFDVLARADFSKYHSAFPFGQQMDQTNFMINLMTKFERTPEMETLLSSVKKIRSGKTEESDDSEYSQETTVKAGVALSSTARFKNLWELKTYKTFPEVEQPTIPYILRLFQKSDDETPKFAMYDCDGGMWKVKLTSVVRDWVKTYAKSSFGESFDRIVFL